jgi:hypothetical protein
VDTLVPDTTLVDYVREPLEDHHVLASAAITGLLQLRPGRPGA